MSNPVETHEQQLARKIAQLWMLIRVNPELFKFTEAQEPNPIMALMDWRSHEKTDDIKDMENIFNQLIKELVKKKPETINIKCDLGNPSLKLPAFNLLEHVHHLGLDLIEQAILETNQENTDKETRINIRRIKQMKKFIKEIGTDIDKLDEKAKSQCAQFSKSTAEPNQLIQQYNEIVTELVKLEEKHDDVTLVHDAALLLHDQVLNDLLKAGAELDRAPKGADTAFVIATKSIFIPIIKSFLPYNFDVSKINLQNASLPALEFLYNRYNTQGNDAYNTQFTGSTDLINILQNKNNLCIADIKTHLPKLWDHLSMKPYYVSISSNSKPIYSRKASLAASTMNGALIAVILGTVLKSSGGTVPSIVNIALISAAVAALVAVATYAYLRRNAAPTETLLLMQAPGREKIIPALPSTSTVPIFNIGANS